MNFELRKSYWSCFFVLCSLFLISCQPSADTKSRGVGFDIAQAEDTTHITVYSPWQQGQVMAQYAITKPLARVICTSATHVGFLHELELTDRLVGVCRPQRIYNLTDSARARMIDIGDDIQPNIEAILLAQPDAVIISTYAEGDPVPQQLSELGIPVFYCNEWTETTPLARAEWIRFFGACFGCLPKADSIYHAVTQAYHASVASHSTQSHLREATNAKPTTLAPASIMSGMSFRGTWYVPAGGTFMGHLLRDAGAQYRYEDNPSTASIPLTMEKALQDFAQADVWVGCNARSLEELSALDEKHTWFKAYQTGRVYNFYRRTNEHGANDFWESGTVHPERILQDLQHVLRGDTSTLYYTLPLHKDIRITN